MKYQTIFKLYEIYLKNQTITLRRELWSLDMVTKLLNDKNLAKIKVK